MLGMLYGVLGHEGGSGTGAGRHGAGRVRMDGTGASAPQPAAARRFAANRALS